MIRQAFVAGKWVDGIPTEQGQRFRYLTPGGFVYGVYEITPPAESMKITRLSFKQRFTTDERMAIRAAASANPLVYDFQDLVDSATYIDLERQDTIAAVNALEQLGLIGAGRAIVILSPPINEDEKWRG